MVYSTGNIVVRSCLVEWQTSIKSRFTNNHPLFSHLMKANLLILIFLVFFLGTHKNQTICHVCNELSAKYAHNIFLSAMSQNSLSGLFTFHCDHTNFTRSLINYFQILCLQFRPIYLSPPSHLTSSKNWSCYNIFGHSSSLLPLVQVSTVFSTSCFFSYLS